MIKPTIGRRVWFWPSSSYVDRNRSVTMLRGDQPFDAGIVYVHHDRMVNLLVTDHVGHVFVVRSVPLLQAGDPSDGKSYDFYCEWMPYQKGQAAKAEGLSDTLQPAQRDALDTLLHVRVPILDQIYDLCQAIEKCGASPELTDAVTKASALREPISELVRQALALGIGDGIVSVGYSDGAPTHCDRCLKPVAECGGHTEALEIETRRYADGAVATGVAPLPELSPAECDALVTSHGVTDASLAPAVALLLASADCCDTNASARDDVGQAEQDLANAASYRLAASLLQVSTGAREEQA